MIKQIILNTSDGLQPVLGAEEEFRGVENKTYGL